jgi:hypothetical protein
MDSNLNHRLPRFYAVHNAYIDQVKKEDISPQNWQKFIKKCGLAHISMSRLEVVDQKKWFLSKIKYGI